MKIINTLTQNLLLSGLVFTYALNFSDLNFQGTTAIREQLLVKTAQAFEAKDFQRCQAIPSSRIFARTELFFGLGKPDGSEVTEAEFQRFLNREVTPRFPDGLTLLAGRGQFKDSSGTIVKEPARLLILLYPTEKLNSSSQKIEQIRKVYKTVFQQESVLRTDESSCVSF
jgi:hypothetical protein